MAEQIQRMGSQPRGMTADELLHSDVPGKWTELVRGELVVHEPPGTWHGIVAARLTVRLGQHAAATAAGEVVAQDTGFRIASDPDTVRAPDVAFISAARMRAVGPSGCAAIAPDLAVEILSAHDRPGDVLAKASDWLRAGVRLVWVVDPNRGVATVYCADGTSGIVPKGGSLDGEDVLPGFSCPLPALLH